MGLASASRPQRTYDWYRPEQPQKYQKSEAGLLGELTGAFHHSLVQSNPEMYGSALEATGVLMGSQNTEGWGRDLQSWAKNLGAGKPPSVPSITDVDGIGDALKFIAGGIGTGVGSTIPSLAGGLAGAGLGAVAAGPPGAAVGGFAGAMLPAFPLNMGEAYKQFKDEGIDRETAATAAAAITPAISALDAAGLFKVVSGSLTRDAKTSILRHVARSIGRGGVVEGGTEGLQSVLREATAAVLTGNPDVKDRALRVVDEAIIGSLTGGTIAGPTSLLSPVKKSDPPPPPDTSVPDDALPEVTPEPPAGTDPAQQAEPAATEPTVKPPPVEPTSTEVDAAANEAATSDVNDLPAPTEAQIEAGNYKKGHVSVQGMAITIENPKDSERTGTGPDGKKWSVKMPAHYGYVLGTRGADQEQIDVYLGEKAESDTVFVVDQVEAETGKFDEHKVFIGFDGGIQEVERTYDAAFDDGRGPDRRQAITEMPMGEFKTWLEQGDNSKPAAPASRKVDKEPAIAPTADEVAAEPATVPVEPELKLDPALPATEPQPSPDTFSFTPDQLGVDPERFQFRSTSNVEGTEGRLKGAEKWNPDASGRLMVWQDKEGKYWVADGHHRLDLAKRLKDKNPSEDIRLNASIVRESDGVTAHAARTMAAMRNIIEGNASPIDAAKVFRDEPDLADRKDIPMTATEAQVARGLAKLGEDSFMMAVNDVVSPRYAAVVGALTPEKNGKPDDALQSGLLKILANEKPSNLFETETMVRDALFAGANRAEQDTLFGAVETVMPLLKERAKMLDWAFKQLRSDRSVFKKLSENVTTIEKLGSNQLDTAANRKRADYDSQALAVLQAVATTKGPISDELNAAAARLNSGSRPAEAGKRLLQVIREGTGRSDESSNEGGSPGPRLDVADESASDLFAGDTGSDVHLSRIAAPTGTGKPIGVDGVNRAIGSIVEGWNKKDAPKVRVVKTTSELPENIRSHIDSQPDAASVAGAFDPTTDTVYLVGDEITSPVHARRVLAHEAVGHYSLMKMLGKDFPALMANVLRLAERDPVVKKLAQKVRGSYGDEVTGNQLAAEVLALMAENGVKRPVMTRMIAKIRRFLRSLGLHLSFNRSEVNDMILRAAQKLQTEGFGETTSNKSKLPAFSRNDEDTADRQERFKGSMKDQVAKRKFYPVDRMFRLLMAPIGGVDANGNWKYGKKITKAGRRLIQEIRPDPNGRLAWADPFIETARHGWLNRYGTSADFIKRERVAQTDKRRIEQEGMAFVEMLADETIGVDEARALQEILEGQEINDARLGRLAEPIRESLDAYGKELVDLGLLPEKTYLRNLGKWLHRSYERYEQDAPPLAKYFRARGKRRRAAITGEELMARGKSHRVPGLATLLKDVPAELRQAASKAQSWIVLDRVKDDKIIKRVYWPADQPVPKKFSEQTGENKELFDEKPRRRWISRGKWNLLRDVKPKAAPRIILRQDYTAEERAEMGEIRDARYNIIKSYHLLAHDLANGRFFKDISENPAWFRTEEPEETFVDANEASRLGTFSGVGWVKVPNAKIPKTDTPRWGSMAGGYVRASIWRDLAELNKMQNPNSWGWLLSQYKQNKTTRSPGVHFNNAMGNLILMDMHDLTIPDLLGAIREYVDKGKFYTEAHEQGIFSSGFVRQELQQQESAKILREVLKEVETQTDKPGAMQNLWNVLSTVDRGMRNAYQFEDEIFRLTSYIRDRVQGDTVEDAAANAIERFLNYDIRAPWPNLLRRTVLPFFSYTYAFVPQIMKAIAQRPWKLAKLFTLGYALQAIGYELTEGDEERERGLMADRDKGLTWSGLPRMFRLPFRGPHDDPLYLDLSRVLPGGGMLETDRGQAGLPEWLLIGGPMSMAVDMMWNREAYSGNDIVNREIDTNVEASAKRLTYVWRSAMPNLPILPGTWSWKMLDQAISDERDIFGRQYNLPIAALRTLGPKLKPQDSEYQYMLRIFEARRALKELRRRAYQLQSDRERRRITKAVLDKGMDDVRVRTKKLTERVAELSRIRAGTNK